MKDILTEIVATKRVELEQAKSVMPLEKVKAEALATYFPVHSMKRHLAQSESGIIAEFKRKSPSKGWIHAGIDPEDVVPYYVRGGASAVSILTDESYFGGSLDFISRIRPMVMSTPILRKDFIIDEYQLYQARAIGADAVLLIAACLGVDECRALVSKAHELGLEVLLEVHSEAELAYVQGEIDMVGVNNRNLGTFHTDVQNSFNIAEALKAAVAAAGMKMPVLVSESGISDPETVKALRAAGYRGFLMGEHFMSHEDPGQALAEFVAAVEGRA